MSVKYFKKYAVTLSAFGNPDHGEDPYSPVVQTQGVHADTIEELQKVVRSFIKEVIL